MSLLISCTSNNVNDKHSSNNNNKQTKTAWPESMSELHWPSDYRLLAKLVPTFADRGSQVVILMDPYSRILGFLDRSHYFFCQAAPQLHSRGWVDPIPDLLLRKSGSAGNRTWTSGSVARISDHQTTKAVNIQIYTMYKYCLLYYVTGVAKLWVILCSSICLKPTVSSIQVNSYNGDHETFIRKDFHLLISSYLIFYKAFDIALSITLAQCVNKTQSHYVPTQFKAWSKEIIAFYST
jgi:hypothetical protein